MAGATRTGLWIAVAIAAAVMGYMVANGEKPGTWLWEIAFPVGIFGAIVLCAWFVGSALERSRIASPAVRAIIVSASSLAAGYAMFVVIAFVVFAVVTSTN